MHRSATGSALLVSVVVALSYGAAEAPAHDPPGAAAQAIQPERWSVRSGITTITFDEQTLAERGVALREPAVTEVPLPDASARQLIIRRDSTLTFDVVDGSVRGVQGGGIANLGDVVLVSPAGEVVLSDLVILPVSGDTFSSLWVAEPRDPATSPGGLVLQRVKAGFDRVSSTLSLRCPELQLSLPLAEALGDASLAGLPMGGLTISANAAWVGGAEPDAPDRSGRPVAGGAVLAGPDMTFCQLYGLYMPSGSRDGDVVGLTVATTSWNIGGSDLMWFNIPDEEHPFIVMNLYRLKDDRFEQIGQSHIKHGFYALGSHQCGGPPCSFEPGHGPGDWLGTNCTDTYSASLNAIQSGMGPKFEVDPWTGVWLYSSSHMNGSHGHPSPITHRLQVRDADLDPAQNADATYYAEGYYVVLDDIDVMNSAAWKPVTVTGSPGGSWFFGMSGAATYPNIGFAPDAWPGATTTLFAQEIPVREFVSPDGRCVLYAKAIDAGGGTWRYEYAMLNIDMHRQGGSFSVPVSAGMVVTNPTFHAVAHHDEPMNCMEHDRVAIDNAAWAVEVGVNAVTWSTATNPLRWGTMYNFGFEADAPPATVTATLGLFRPGSALNELTGETIGPEAAPCSADLNGDGAVDTTDFLELLAAWGPNPGHPADLDGNGTVDTTDFLELLASWGPC